MRTINARHEIITHIDGTEILKTIEAIGRTCYKSEDKITGDSCIGFVQRIIQRGHEAILEHFNISVRIFCDRGVSHEIVRHRVASYAQESTRYCDYSRDKFGSGVNYIDLAAGMKLDPKVSTLDAAQLSAIYEEWYNACLDAERHYLNMLALGATPQIARSVLNNSTKTEIVVTMNLREWRYFFRLRSASAAHPQMREVAIPLLKEFKEKIPMVFDDIPVPED